MKKINFEVKEGYLAPQTSLPKKLKISIYTDPVEIWASSWPEELSDGESYVGIDKDGNEIEYSDSDGIAGIREQGCFGFVKWDEELHVYFDPNKADFSDLIQLIGHEIGHFQRPNKRDFMAEEMKAEHYSDFAGYVFKILETLKINSTDIT